MKKFHVQLGAPVGEPLSKFVDEPGRRVHRNLEVIRPGTYYGMTGRIEVNEDMLQQVLANFDAGDPPPLQSGHSMSPDDTHGIVPDLWIENGVLQATAAFIGTHAVERVEDGRWRKFSGGFQFDEQRGWSLDHVGVTPFPACETATLLSRVENEEIMSKPDEPTPEVEGTEEKGILKRLLSLFQNESQLEVELEKKKAFLAAKEAEIQAADAQLAEKKAYLNKQACQEIHLELLREGFSTPAVAESEVAFLEQLTDEQRQTYAALRKGGPQAWEPSRISEPAIEDDPEESEARLSRMREHTKTLNN